MKIPSSYGQTFVQSGSGIPEGIEKSVLAPVRDIVQQRGHFRRQKVFWQLSVMPGHLAKGERTAVVHTGRLSVWGQGREGTIKGGQIHGVPVFLVTLRKFCRVTPLPDSHFSRSAI